MSGYLNKYNLQGWLHKDAKLFGNEDKQQYVLNILESKTCKKRKNETDDDYYERKNNIVGRYLTIYCPPAMTWIGEYKKDDLVLCNVKITEEKIWTDKDGNQFIKKVCNLQDVINITQNTAYMQKRKATQAANSNTGDVPREVCAAPDDCPF